MLAHDIHPGTIEAMPSTFDELEAKGFKFVTVSELLGMATPETPHPKAQPAEKSAPKAEAPQNAAAKAPAPKAEPADKTAAKGAPTAVPAATPGG